jgi:hypothetical protein
MQRPLVGRQPTGGCYLLVFSKKKASFEAFFFEKRPENGCRRLHAAGPAWGMRLFFCAARFPRPL